MKSIQICTCCKYRLYQQSTGFYYITEYGKSLSHALRPSAESSYIDDLVRTNIDFVWECITILGTSDDDFYLNGL